MRGPLITGGIKNIRSGWRRIRSQPALFRIVFAKASWNIAGGGLAGVYLVLMGVDVRGFGAAFGFGLFFARGVGTGLGPILARVFEKRRSMALLVGYLIVVSGLVYFMVGLSVSYALWITVLLVILAHSASGANWVLSTVMMQQWVEDEVRGRVFSTDMLILSVAFSTSTSVAWYLMENTNLGIQNGIMVFASVMVLSGLVFSMWKPEPPMTKLHSA